MKRFCVLISLVLFLCACCGKYDASYAVDVAQPAYTSSHPRVLFDEAHHNHHRMSTSYRPFAKLLANDGYRVIPLRKDVTPHNLADAAVLVVVTAMGHDEAGMTMPFTEAECDAIEAWVRGGGSLLVVTDHFPFGQDVANLTRRFGVESSGGMTFDEKHHEARDDSQLVFSRENGLLAEHEITRGVRRVMTFTGESVRGGTPLLKLSETAVNRPAKVRVTRSGGDTRVEVEYGDPQSARGWSQGVVIEHGRGRVCVLAEAAMLSAQREGERRIGMNYPGCDNRQFALNVMHWLTRHS
ncbi:MAG: hypothetical protein AABO58_23820 [Acidobacteriota bacterium]